MSRSHLLWILSPVILGLAGCAQSGQPSNESLVAEARSFMASYAGDIRNHDGAAVGDRYDRSGTHFRGSYQVFDSTRVFYEERWSGPTAFDFQKLSFEVLGPEAVLVTGQCTWGRGDSLEALVINYAAVLRMDDGKLRIRVEDETVVSP